MTEKRAGVTKERVGVTENRVGVTEKQAGVTENRAGVPEKRAGVSEISFVWTHPDRDRKTGWCDPIVAPIVRPIVARGDTDIQKSTVSHKDSLKNQHFCGPARTTSETIVGTDLGHKGPDLGHKGPEFGSHEPKFGSHPARAFLSLPRSPCGGRPMRTTRSLKTGLQIR